MGETGKVAAEAEKDTGEPSWEKSPTGKIALATGKVGAGTGKVPVEP